MTSSSVFLVLLLAAFLTGCQPPSGSSDPEALVAQARKAIAAGQAVLLDVREQEEWDEGHFADARLLPMSQLWDLDTRESALASLAKGTRYFVHCKAGVRAQKCASLLESRGFDVVALPVPFETIAAAGFPLGPASQ